MASRNPTSPSTSPTCRGTKIKFGITFGQLHHAVWDDAAVLADELGYESLWLPEHLVIPAAIEGELKPGEAHPPLDPDLPVFDVAAYLGMLAGRTSQVLLGTFVYLLGIRHPFAGARAFATIDQLSDGRAICGVGAGWLRTEWTAAGLDPSTRGARLDEAIDVTRRLWTEDRVAHRGAHWSFDEVGFAPKPVQSGGVPIHVGGESDAALRRTAERGDGWLGMDHTPVTAAAAVERLRAACDATGRDELPEVTVLAVRPEAQDVAAFGEAGVDRLIVVPWSSSRTALADLRGFAEAFGLEAA